MGGGRGRIGVTRVGRLLALTGLLLLLLLLVLMLLLLLLGEVVVRHGRSSVLRGRRGGEGRLQRLIGIRGGDGRRVSDRRIERRRERTVVMYGSSRGLLLRRVVERRRAARSGQRSDRGRGRLVPHCSRAQSGVGGGVSRVVGVRGGGGRGRGEVDRVLQSGWSGDGDLLL